MPRKPAKERNLIRGATPVRDYEIGDEVFFSFGGTAGQALFIGQLREDETCLVLASPEDPGIEMPAIYLDNLGRKAVAAIVDLGHHRWLRLKSRDGKPTDNVTKRFRSMRA